MAKYRTLEAVTFVWDGVVTSVEPNRELELTDDEVKTLHGKVVLVDNMSPTMFPDGAPIIEPAIVRTVPATPVAGETVDVPKPEKASAPKVK